jgi:hypothetical protein
VILRQTQALRLGKGLLQLGGKFFDPHRGYSSKGSLAAASCIKVLGWCVWQQEVGLI